MNAPLSSALIPQVPEPWEQPASPAATAAQRRPLQVLAGACAVLLLLAVVVPIGGAVIGAGSVGVESRVKRIAHPTGGVIAAIMVVNGQHVKAGQLLMRLDDRVTGADATYSNLSVEQLLAQRARLEAERLGAPAIAFPPELTASTSPSAARAMQDEQRLFAIHRSEEGQLRAQLSARIVQFNQQIAGYHSQIAALQRQSALIEPERRSVQDLWNKQLVTISRLNELERTAADFQGNIGALQAQIASTRARITEAQEQAIQLSETRRSQAGTELGQTTLALNQQQTRSIAATDQQNRSEIRAPYSGTVEKIAFSAVGDVVKPAEPIMEIVPDADRMVVEAAVTTDDIDQVRKGQSARIRFASFNRAATPEIDGTVTYVATDRTDVQPGQGRPYYTVRIAVDQDRVRREGLALRSGMPAEVYIQTGNRSLMSYILKPLADQFARAFRDS
ncbi:HlyD family type I secretion periplasmic adaptor subunit [Novosphingobium bradum]|uniref:Membrane fusion protein (MFP) family protein n=1 Tax=Novosphingobium bradum TaxID=1737444 RepID=A0ABV7ISS3_9SPHN